MLGAETHPAGAAGQHAGDSFEPADQHAASRSILGELISSQQSILAAHQRELEVLAGRGSVREVVRLNNSPDFMRPIKKRPSVT